MYRPGQIFQLLASLCVLDRRRDLACRKKCLSKRLYVCFPSCKTDRNRIVEIPFRQPPRMRCPGGRRTIDHNQLRRYGKLHVHSSSPILYRIRTLVPIFATPHQNPSVQCLKRLFPTTATREDAPPLSCGRSSSSARDYHGSTTTRPRTIRADVNTQDGEYGNALYAAACSGNAAWQRS